MERPEAIFVLCSLLLIGALFAIVIIASPSDESQVISSPTPLPTPQQPLTPENNSDSSGGFGIYVGPHLNTGTGQFEYGSKPYFGFPGVGIGGFP